MATPGEVVLQFIAMLEKPGGFADAVRAYFTPQTRYLNVGMSDTTGVEEALAFIGGFEMTTGAVSMRADMLTFAESGNTVLTERVDHLCDHQGEIVMSIPLMGAFDVAGDKIIGWRDYFDTAGLAGAAAG